jgi:Domain of unknown function (DUF4832)/Domain of unknown function (DUF4874)
MSANEVPGRLPEDANNSTQVVFPDPVDCANCCFLGPPMAYPTRIRNTHPAMAALIAALLHIGGSAAAPQSGEAAQTIRYSASLADFPNPERGFHQVGSLNTSDEWGPPDADFSYVRAEGLSLVRGHVRLDAYRDRLLPDSMLNELRASLGRVRDAGVKTLMVISYNFDESGTDAPLPLVLQHIEQLAPVLRESADVIAALETGFIGAWGEWHSSTNDLDTLRNKRIILEAILRALPPSRMMQIRTPFDLTTFFPQPLTRATAYSGSDASRTGFANLCFLANDSDAGTWLPQDRADEFKAYIARSGAFFAVGGETCDVSWPDDRSDCPTALDEVKRFHYSYLNGQFFAPVLERWKREGCYGDIARGMGYRFRLERATIDTQASPGSRLNAQLTMANDGTARPYNPRSVEMVLRSRADGSVRRLALRPPVDERLWLPEGGRTHTLDAGVDLPSDLPPGRYDLLLNLPDPEPSVNTRAEYSIRLANDGLWEAGSGFNSLKASVLIRVALAGSAGR